MAGHDKLTDLYAPNLISQFDDIPGDTELTFSMTKAELALLIKSQWQLHQGLQSLLTAVGAIAYIDEARNPLSTAYQSLQASQQALNLAATHLIEKAVGQWMLEHE